MARVGIATRSDGPYRLHLRHVKKIITTTVLNDSVCAEEAVSNVKKIMLLPSVAYLSSGLVWA
jgi:hypothetical protein